MLKRTLVLFGFFMFFFCCSFFLLDDISTREALHDAAVVQQSYKVKISDVRGTIYDCRNVPLINNGKKLVAAVIPSVESLNCLNQVVPQSSMEYLYKKCASNAPFTVEVNEPVHCPFIKIFEVPVRFSGITLASHIIGYLSAEKQGVIGIEKAYNDFLAGEEHNIYVKYNVDAANRILPGEKNLIEDKSYLQTKGVVLNLDSKIQALVEEVANKYITRGAVIITEVPNCEIRASASLPGFLPQGVGDYLNDKNSPLLNRAFCKFDLGSAFKIITSAASLESGISEDFLYFCEGKNKIEDTVFKCHNSKKHEWITLEQAFAHSCNGYFIELSKKMKHDEILNMSKKFRLGVPSTFAPDMVSSEGLLPNAESLENPKRLANFSFGQGKMLVTPVQVAALVNVVASKGIYTQPKLVKGLVDEAMKLITNDSTKIEYETERVISERTAEKLKRYMKASIDYGTSIKGKPKFLEAAAKTSTAQTGIIEDGKKIEQSWYAGFFPYENPKYSIVVLSEAGAGGGESCGPVFKEIVNRMHVELPELFV